MSMFERNEITHGESEDAGAGPGRMPRLYLTEVI